MITFVVEVALNKNFCYLYSHFYFCFERKKNSLNFFIIISQVYGKLDLVSALWSVEIIEHKEVVIFKIALPSEKLQTNNVNTKGLLFDYEVPKVPTSNMKRGCCYY